MQKMNSLMVVCVVTIEEIPEGEYGEIQTILVDSGADAAVFPERFATAGMAAQASGLQLHDAQGRSIPVTGTRDLEIHLTDETGRRIVLQEQVAFSSFVQQPILCYGRLMQRGRGVSATDQSLVHSTGIKVPLEMQNQSMVVRGAIRAISGNDGAVETGEAAHSVRAVKAVVRPEVLRGELGWHLVLELEDMLQRPTKIQLSFAVT